MMLYPFIFWHAVWAGMLDAHTQNGRAFEAWWVLQNLPHPYVSTELGRER